MAKSELALIRSLRVGVKNPDFSRYAAAEKVNERPLEGPGVPWQRFDGSCFSLTGEDWSRSFLLPPLPQLLQCLLLLVTFQSSSQLKWMRVVDCLVLASSF